MTEIHRSATISSKASIAEDVRIGPNAVILDDVTIGSGSVIGPNVVIHPYTTLGAACRVHAGAILGDVPQDMAFEESTVSYVTIGDRCVIREGVTIHRGTKAETATRIGNDCFLMAFSHFGHNVVLGDRVIVVNASLLAGYVEVDDGVFIGGASVVHQFVKIGTLAMLGGMSGIGKDVPPYCMTVSAARNRISGLNVIGLKRAGIKPDERKQIKSAFAVLFRSGLNTSQAMERIENEFPTGPASAFSAFLERSNRGLCAMSTRDSE